MSTLLEIETAAEALAPEEKKALFHHLASQLGLPIPPPPLQPLQPARLIIRGDDVLLEASPDAPPMTPENVKRMLEDYP